MNDEEFRRRVLEKLSRLNDSIWTVGFLVAMMVSCTGCVAREPKPCEVWMTGRDGGWTCVSRDTFDRWARKNLPAS